MYYDYCLYSLVYNVFCKDIMKNIDTSNKPITMPYLSVINIPMPKYNILRFKSKCMVLSMFYNLN